jgi:hypothetical protein
VEADGAAVAAGIFTRANKSGAAEAESPRWRGGGVGGCEWVGWRQGEESRDTSDKLAERGRETTAAAAAGIGWHSSDWPPEALPATTTVPAADTEHWTPPEAEAAAAAAAPDLNM